MNKYAIAKSPNPSNFFAFVNSYIVTKGLSLFPLTIAEDWSLTIDKHTSIELRIFELCKEEGRYHRSNIEAIAELVPIEETFTSKGRAWRTSYSAHVPHGHTTFYVQTVQSWISQVCSSSVMFYFIFIYSKYILKIV